MTYKELARKIAAMTEEQKNCDVTIIDNEDEYFAATLTFTENVADVLDPNHPVIVSKFRL